MKALITGGCGFLGSSIAMALVKQGCQVVLLDIPDANPAAISELDLELIRADIRDRDKVSQAVKGCQWVFHTAALATFWKRKNKLQWDVNVHGTRVVMEMCVRQGVERVVHTSSINALGFSRDQGILGNEETLFNWEPFHIGYMNTKYASEQLVLEMCRQDHLPAVVVNPGTIFGSHPSMNLNANMYIVEIAGGRGWIYPKGGTNCVGIEDVVEGHLLAATKGRVGERYILGGENLSYKELFDLIAEELGKKPPTLQAPYSLALGISWLLEKVSYLSGKAPLFSPEMIRASSVNCFYSNEKAKKELGFSPKPFRKVLRDTIEYLRSTGKLTMGSNS